jgi:hypothetical protein
MASNMRQHADHGGIDGTDRNLSCRVAGDRPGDLGPLDGKTLTAVPLAKPLVALDAPDMRARAAELGTALARDRGVEAAVELLERLDFTSKK